MINSYNDRYRLFPEDGGAFAVWAIDKYGSVLGLLPDGSGGGSMLEEIAQACKDTGRKAAWLQLNDPGMGLPYAGFVSLQKAISMQILRYAAVVTTIENPQVPEACGGLGDLGCDLIEDVAADFVPGYSYIDTADDIAEAASGEGLVNC